MAKRGKRPLFEPDVPQRKRNLKGGTFQEVSFRKRRRKEEDSIEVRLIVSSRVLALETNAAPLSRCNVRKAD